MIQRLLPLTVLAFAWPLCPHDIITTKLTYTREVSRILARRCLSCHSVDSSVPLVSYEQVRPWAVSIKEQVLSRQMPPWGAVKGFGDLSPDNGLTQEELLVLSGWVVGGAPEGSPTFLPHFQPGNAAIRREALLEDALVVANRSVIRKPLGLSGIRPLTATAVASARIVARFPDGHRQPLLWLFDYQPQWKQNFRFREPIELPPGTSVESDQPLDFALERAR